ncbi:MAG: PUA domain containing protein [Promethearchaeota archaeon]|jgi:PUA domain protein|nr:MAG: PUA domain containing protein [Candidatus Lokiarchaeota archaeon]
MNITKRHFIRKDELDELKQSLGEMYGETFIEEVFPKKSRVEIIITEEDDNLYAINGKLALWNSKEGYIPVLPFLLDNRIGLKSIIVDMGAVPYVTLNQADIMRPGITEIDSSIEKGDIVRIADEKNNRTLAVGKAMYGAKEMEQKEKGKVVKNLHTINDDMWEFAERF